MENRWTFEHVVALVWVFVEGGASGKLNYFHSIAEL